MWLLLLLTQYALAAIFELAGIAKLLDLRGTRATMETFGAPHSLSSSLSLVLPVAELIIAAGLMFPFTAVPAAIAALVLLLLFIAVVGLTLLRGQKPDCHCFGQLSSRPVGWQTLARNILFAIGAVVLVTNRSEVASPETLLPFAGVILLPAVSALAIYWQRRNAARPTTLSSSEKRGLAIGSVAPRFELADYDGGIRSLDSLLQAGKPLLLVFTSPFCGPCVSLFQEIGEWQRTHIDRILVVIISRGTIKENFVNTVKNGLNNVLLQDATEVAERYQANVTPTAVMISPEGRIASLVSAGAEEIRTLLKTFLSVADLQAVTETEFATRKSYTSREPLSG